MTPELAADSSTQPKVLTRQEFRTFAPDLSVLVGIVVLNYVLFSGSLPGYFLADDYVHITWLQDVINGHPEKLLANFTGNWMQAQGTQFYRPVISLTLALDYFLGNGSPLPFHLSNIFFQAAAAVLLYIFVRLLTDRNGKGTSRLLSGTTAALFSACPLHPEVVSWIIGRVDSVCLMFFMASLVCYAVFRQSSRKIAAVLSLFFGACALGSKEMAAVLPPVMVLLELTRAEGGPLLQRLKAAFKATFMWWVLLVLYLVVRAAVLGTVAGGYGGSVGEGFSTTIARRLLDGSLLRILLPFNEALFTGKDPLRKALMLVYAGMGLWTLSRLFLLPVLWRDKDSSSPKRESYFSRCGFNGLLILAAGWTVLAFLPALPVFTLSSMLQCSRFVYAATAPLSLLAALVIVPVFSRNEGELNSKEKKTIYVSAFLAAALICVLGLITFKNNQPWSSAFTQVRSFRQAVESKRKDYPESQYEIAVLTIPNQREGAHMIYNGAMLGVLLSPPLTSPPLRVLSFEPVTYGDSELVSASRIRKLQATGRVKFFRWQAEDRELVPVSFSGTGNLTVSSGLPASFNIPQKQGETTTRFTSPILDLDPLSCDFVEVMVQANSSALQGEKRIHLLWSPEASPGDNLVRSMSLALLTDGKPHTYIFPVGERKSWIGSGTIGRLTLELPGVDGSGCRLVSVVSKISADLCPELSVESKSEGADGIVQLDSVTTFQADSTGVSGAKSVELEASKPDSWFEHYSGTLKDTKRSANTSFRKSLPVSGLFHLKPEDFPRSGFYQLRAFALDQSGTPTGFSSDPINLQVSK